MHVKPMPSNPSLILFRNQAQSIAAAHASCDPRAAARLRAAMPEMADLSDDDIFQAELGVNDARRVIAREYGFDDWDALRTRVEPTSTYTARSSPRRSPLSPDHEFFQAVGALDLASVRRLLERDRSLANADVRGNAAIRGTWGWGAPWGDPQEWATARAVHFAAYGHADLLQLLVKYRADVDAFGYEGNHQWATPLVLACWEGSRETVQILLEAGANPNLPAIQGGSPLHSAINHWDPWKIEILLRHGARHDQFSAAVVGDVEELKQQFGEYENARQNFPEWNGFINRRDIYRNRTALEWAAFRRQEEAADYLIELGEEVTPQVAICLGMMDEIRRLVEEDPDFPNRKTGADWPDPPLVWAVRSGQVKVVEYLLSVGADPNGQGAWTQMPLPMAVDLPVETSIEIVDALIAAGADVNAERRWMTHLGEFTTKGNLQAADLLIQHGADVDKKNQRGLTPLQAMIYPPSWTERYGDPIPNIEFLLARGADINAPSEDGKTALDIAIEQENEDVANLLCERGGIRARSSC